MNIKTVKSFIEAINKHNIKEIYSLMAEDFLFVDTWANEIHGREDMKNSWEGYFEWFPDYLIEAAEILECKNIISVFGFAGGTYHGEKTQDKKNRWRLPAAWKVKAENGKIKHWQVYCDSKIPFDIMDMNDKEKVNTLKNEKLL